MESPSKDPDVTHPDARPSTAAPSAEDSAEPSPGEAFHAAQRTLAQFAEYVRHYIAARLDALRLSARNAIFYAILGIIGAIILIAAVATAVVLTCVGMSQAIGALLGHHAWLGNLIVGVLLLSGIIGALFFIRHGMARASEEKMERKYAVRRKQQRATFGEDVSQPTNNHGH